MAALERMTRFAGMPVVDWRPGLRHPRGRRAVAYRISDPSGDAYEGDDWSERFELLLETPEAQQIRALVFGAWDEDIAGTPSDGIVRTLAKNAARLPRLRALFIGDITEEECQISWLEQSDMSPALNAFPKLEVFGVRGGTGLGFVRLRRHAGLRRLVVETGGLPSSVVAQLEKADLPALEHLELWLGEPNYGNSVTPSSLRKLLSGKSFPKLKYLGLRNAANADAVAEVVADAPLVRGLEVLDLSLGALGDSGADALLRGRAVRRLRKLDLHHHFLSTDMIRRLKSLKIRVGVREQQKTYDFGDGRTHRYVAVGE
jgi:hypothetical protein